MSDLAIARLLHVLAVVVWSAGWRWLRWVVLPAARAARDPDLFERLERRFAAQVRWTLIVAGLSGLYLVERLGLWPRFAEVRDAAHCASTLHRKGSQGFRHVGVTRL